jgi:hypothetical protein
VGLVYKEQWKSQRRGWPLEQISAAQLYQPAGEDA